MVELLEAMSDRGHEQVVFGADAETGLRVIVAVHSTALGPALGGVRFWSYDSEEAALLDALRLSEAMTLKAAVAGLDQGGGKAVVLVDDPLQPRSDDFLLALGRVIHELGGRYLASEDVGATQRDMDVIARVTPWVTGVDPDRGGSGSPSPMTAFGVSRAMRAVARELDGPGTLLAGKRVVIQGAGSVGSVLARLLVGEGARVAVADVDRIRVEALVAELGVDALDVHEVLEAECDVFAPCALGPVFDRSTVERLRCRAICGAANNQLADESLDGELARRGIVYAPDFVVNAGGIINVAGEFTGYSHAAARERTAGIEATTAAVFARSRRDRIPPDAAARRLARERIARDGVGRRWQPGDPTAWTHGAPLTTLRPARVVAD